MVHLIPDRVVTRSRALALSSLVTALMVAVLLAASQAYATTTFTVTNTNDSGAGSLRQAILDANANDNPSEVDRINFNIPGTGVKTISPNPELPQITEAVTIDGYTQPGAHPNTKAVGNDADLKIELSGQSAGASVSGLRIEAANSTVKGLIINRWIGEGITISGSGSTGNRVAGNYVGTDASGTQDLGNFAQGVSILGAPNNTIGGTTAGGRNVISANGEAGVRIYGAGATGNEVKGNYVGTDKTGIAPLGNSDGVFIEEAPANTIGGTEAGARNVISANKSEGVVILGNGATGNEVRGNYVGTGASGQGDLGNVDYGVTIVGAPNSVVGGTEPGARNIISGSGVGVFIAGNGATGNRVLSNSIFSNGGLGIDLYGTDGPTPNDPDDPDTGPNNLQNKPVLSSAKKNATGTTTIKGTLNSTPNSTFKVQFFSNPEGTDEGKMLLGTETVSTDGSGDVSLTFSTTKTIGLGQNITATDPGGNTSEFSAPRKVVAR